MCPELCIPRQLRGLEGDCGSGIGQLQLHQPPTSRMKIAMHRRCFVCVCVCVRVRVRARVYVCVRAHACVCVHSVFGLRSLES